MIYNNSENHLYFYIKEAKAYCDRYYALYFGEGKYFNVIKTQNITTRTEYSPEYAVESLVDIERMIVSTKVSMSTDNTYNCTKVIISKKIDICRILESASTIPLINFAIEEILKTVDFEPKCPFKKRIYRIANVTMSNIANFIPLGNNTKVCGEVEIIAKPVGKKNFVKMHHAYAYGILIH